MTKYNIFQKVATLFYCALIIFWLGLTVANQRDGNWNYLYSFLFGLVPLLGGIVGIIQSSIWGRFKSSLGKAIFFVSLGLTLWGLGETIWSYYNVVKHVPAPYPSIADIGFAPSIFFWVLGITYFSVATGALFTLKKSHRAKYFIIVVPLVLLILSYYLQVTLARGGTLVPSDETALKTVLDIAYPFGDFLAVTFATVVYALSYKLFGGFYRTAISYILAGTAMMFVGDTVFSYTTTKGSYYNGNIGDLILTTGLFCITFGILAFAAKPPAKERA